MACLLRAGLNLINLYHFISIVHVKNISVVDAIIMLILYSHIDYHFAE